MTLGDRIRKDPIRALVWIEAIATILAAAIDLSLVLTLDPSQETHDRRIYFVTALVTLACIATVFSIPHASNQRYAAVAVALVSLACIGWLPPDGLLLFILSATLAARLTFAFGFRGAASAWAVACSAIVLRAISATIGPLHVAASGPAQSLLDYVESILPTAVLLALIFGMIGLMKVYATSSADAAASSERSRIALDLHDFLGHGLTTLRVQLQNAERYRSSDPTKADDYVRRAAASSGELLADVRETVTLLHDDAERTTPSFESLFERLCADFSTTHSTVVASTMEFTQEPSGRISVALYRMIQEALTNVARHASAEHVWVVVRGDDHHIEATVEDDGSGMSADTSSNGHGLMSMRERIAGVSGTFSIGDRPGKGTIVHAVVPVEATR